MSSDFRVMEPKCFLTLFILKGHNSLNIIHGVIVSFSAHHLIVVFICINFRENIMNGFRVMERTQFQCYYKGHKSVKIVRGVIVLVLCILSNHGLHMYQVKHKYIEWYKSCEAERISTVIKTKVHYFFKNVSTVHAVILRPFCNHDLHCTRFRENILNGLRVFKRTQFHYL